METVEMAEKTETVEMAETVGINELGAVKPFIASLSNNLNST